MSDDSDLMRSILQAAARKHAVAFEEAKAAALAAGKEPFDLERLDTDWPSNPDNRTASMGKVLPTERRLADWEPIYYEQNPTVMTMGDFITKMKRLQLEGVFD